MGIAYLRVDCGADGTVSGACGVEAAGVARGVAAC